MSTGQTMEGAGGKVVMSQPYVPETSPGKVVDNKTPSLLKESAGKVLEKSVTDVSVAHSSRSRAGTFVHLTATIVSDQARITRHATDGTLTKSASASMETTLSFDATDQNLQAQVNAATALTLEQQEEVDHSRDSSHNNSRPTEAAPTGAVTLRSQDPQPHDDATLLRVHRQGKESWEDYVCGQSFNAPTYHDFIPAGKSATDELSARSTSPTVFSSSTPNGRSPIAIPTISIANKRQGGAESHVIQELNEIKSMLATINTRSSAELESTKSSLAEQFTGELAAARTSISAQLAAELESIKASMMGQLTATRLESTRASMREEILADAEAKQTGMKEEILIEVEAKRTAIKNQLSAELEATRGMLKSQLITELEAVRTLMGEKISEKLAVVVPESVSNQVSASIEEALTDLSGQLQTGFGTALESMSNTISEAIVSTQASVDGVHLRMAELEWSIRGVWPTMAAERVNPKQALQEAIGLRESQSRWQRGRKDNDLREDEHEGREDSEEVVSSP